MSTESRRPMSKTAHPSINWTPPPSIWWTPPVQDVDHPRPSGGHDHLKNDHLVHSPSEGCTWCPRSKTGDEALPEDEPRETPTPLRPYSVAESRLLAAQGQRQRQQRGRGER